MAVEGCWGARWLGEQKACMRWLQVLSGKMERRMESPKASIGAAAPSSGKTWLQQWFRDKGPREPLFSSHCLTVWIANTLAKNNHWCHQPLPLPLEESPGPGEQVETLGWPLVLPTPAPFLSHYQTSTSTAQFALWFSSFLLPFFFFFFKEILYLSES